MNIVDRYVQYHTGDYVQYHTGDYVQYHTGDYVQYLSKLSLPQLLKRGLTAWWSSLTSLKL